MERVGESDESEWMDSSIEWYGRIVTTHVSLGEAFFVGLDVPEVDEPVVASGSEHFAPGAESERRGDARAARGLDLVHVRGLVPDVEHPEGAFDGGIDAQALGGEGLALDSVAGEALSPRLSDAAAAAVIFCRCRHSDQLVLLLNVNDDSDCNLDEEAGSGGVRKSQSYGGGKQRITVASSDNEAVDHCGGRCNC